MTKLTSQWWRNATIYQIYLRSFQDSNGDGIGDLRGVSRRLDYLKSLGVDALWLSPIMPSPNEDWGYDITDFYAVDPALGTLQDLDELIAGAGQRGMAVLMDLVPTHTSGHHPWFKNALSGKEAAYRRYYVWARPRADGGPPNNWTMVTGASAWVLDQASGEYYLCNFLPGQPDLNWWHPAVHEEFERILRFWSDRGVAGFRIDVAQGLYKDDQLRDDPPPGPGDHPVVRAGRLRSVYSGNRPEVHPVYRRWREIASSYDPERVLLGETYVFDFADLASFYGREGPELHMAFNFPFFFAELRAPDLAQVVEATLAELPSGAVPVWTASNHDAGRFASRWCGGDVAKVKAALVMLATLPGALVLYQGDELGMTDVDVPVEQRLDFPGLADHNGLGRDRCRTPMHWSPAINAGFTDEGVCPWLPLGEHSAINAEREGEDPTSVLNLWRTLAAMRKAGRIAASEKMERVQTNEQVWAYRVGQSTTIANLSDRRAHVTALAAARAPVAVSSSGMCEGEVLGQEFELRPWEVLVVLAE